MFSESLKKMDEMPYKSMLGVAAVLVMLCQLVAMGLVVDGQVKRAEARDSVQDSRRIAVAACNEADSVATRQSCIQQATGGWRGPDQAGGEKQLRAMLNSGVADRADALAVTLQGVTAAFYTSR